MQVNLILIQEREDLTKHIKSLLETIIFATIKLHAEYGIKDNHILDSLYLLLMLLESEI